MPRVTSGKVDVATGGREVEALILSFELRLDVRWASLRHQLDDGLYNTTHVELCRGRELDVRLFLYRHLQCDHNKHGGLSQTTG